MKATILTAFSVGVLTLMSAIIQTPTASACPGDDKTPKLSCPGDKKPSLHCPGDKKPSFDCPGDKTPKSAGRSF